jgi:DNA uptake protein ComE-like DNA-binding protein
MRTLTLVITLFLASVATAKEATQLAGDAIVDSHAVGKLNVNTATRAQLLKVPGLDEATADGLIACRPIRDLGSVVPALPTSALEHLKTDGTPTFTRIVQGPLVRLDVTSSAAR